MKEIVVAVKEFLLYLFDWIRQKKSTETSKWNRTEAIVDTLNLMIGDFHCDRAYIIRRHNGGKYWDGTSMKKISIAEEAVRPGISPKALFVQDILISHVIKWYQLTKRDKFYFFDAMEIEDPVTRSYMIRWGIKSIVNIPIFLPSFEMGQEPVAWLGMEWVNQYAPDFCDTYGSAEEAIKLGKAQAESLKQLLF